MRGRADGHIGISRKQTPHWFIPYHAGTAILLCSRTANVDVPRTGLVNGFTLVGSAKVLCDEIHNRHRSTLGTPPCLGGCFQWGKGAGRPSNTAQKYGTSVRVNRMESHWVPLPAWRRLGAPEPLVGPASVPLEPEIMTAGTRDRLGLRLICNGYGSRALFLDM